MKKRKTVRIGDVLHTGGKIIKVGNALGVTLPASWVREHGLRQGDELVKVANSILTVSVKPKEA